MEFMRNSPQMEMDTKVYNDFDYGHTAAVKHGFNPYTMNGGTIAAVAGEDFCIVAGDTRQSEGYSINTRYAPKTFELTSKCVLSCAGFYGDMMTFKKSVEYNIKAYGFEHEKEISTEALAQRLMSTLYFKRFFPYYAYTILGGLDKDGRGAVYHYDVVGSYEREDYRADGSGVTLLQPFFDNQLGKKNMVGEVKKLPTLEQARTIIRDAFNAATERDIYTGDFLEMKIITANGITTERYDLKKD